MIALKQVDGAKAHVLVDDVADPLSSVPAFVETEFEALEKRRGGAWVLGQDSHCTAAHGISLLITVRHGSAIKSLLFDSGPDDRTLEQNVSRLGIDMGAVEAIVPSHGHCDHAGGGSMLRALQLVRDHNGGRKVPYYCHPDMFRRRAFRLPSGSLRILEDVPSTEALTNYGADIVNTKEPQLLLDGCVYLSGEIPRVTSFEHGLPGQYRKTPDGDAWQPDELVLDERFVAVNVAGKGIVVFTGCSHPGIVNILKHAKACFPDVRLHAVMGGLHLVGMNEAIIPETVEAMRAFDLDIIAPGHCTGWRGVAALASAFGDRKVAPMSVGKRFSF